MILFVVTWITSWTINVYNVANWCKHGKVLNESDSKLCTNFEFCEGKKP